ncbi:hypothetical protein KI387_001989, partial [Taxus chinensis]
MTVNAMHAKWCTAGEMPEDLRWIEREDRAWFRLLSAEQCAAGSGSADLRSVDLERIFRFGATEGPGSLNISGGLVNHHFAESEQAQKSGCDLRKIVKRARARVALGWVTSREVPGFGSQSCR